MNAFSTISLLIGDNTRISGCYLPLILGPVVGLEILTFPQTNGTTELTLVSPRNNDDDDDNNNNNTHHQN